MVSRLVWQNKNSYDYNKKEILAFMIILTSDKVKGRQYLELALSRCEQNTVHCQKKTSKFIADIRVQYAALMLSSEEAFRFQFLNKNFVFTLA